MPFVSSRTQMCIRDRLRVTQGGKAGSIVRSSAAPDVPELVYVVPTFRWSRPAATGNTRTSTRLGNGLRVYLERPWFSSGDGELLGVVLSLIHI